VLDGAMGTMLQQCNLTPRTSAAPRSKLQRKSSAHPADVVLDIHRKYFDAGSDIVNQQFWQRSIVLANTA